LGYTINSYKSLLTFGKVTNELEVDHLTFLLILGYLQKFYLMESLISKLIQKGKFLIEDNDLTKSLIELTDTIEKSKDYEKQLIFSLLDRWRKGRYMEADTVESLLYTDETTLSYFHILELLSAIYSKELKEKSKELIDDFVKSFNVDVLSINESSLTNENVAKSKILTSLLSKDISVSAKILFLLKKLNLYSNQTAFWIKKLIDSRNNVAHGRRVFYDKAVYPVQPFFPLNNDNLYPLKFLRILTAQTICCHLGISLYHDKWTKINDSLIYDISHTKEFLSNEKFKSLNKLSKEERLLVMGGVNYHVLSKGLKPELCRSFLEFYLKAESKNGEFLASNIDLIVLLYEAEIEQSQIDLLENAILSVEETESNPYMKFRDLRYYLDFHGFQSPKIEKLIINGKVK
jgi:hypothetical protein